MTSEPLKINKKAAEKLHRRHAPIERQTPICDGNRIGRNSSHLDFGFLNPDTQRDVPQFGRKKTGADPASNNEYGTDSGSTEDF